ncbi:MAG: ribosome biogenesis GTPase YlqF [Acholeplasmatales bacterium]|jgi:ribosome biogenesis GTPase A|nr:ribosome biogenesis GTPase YlqF [Acholeplasmatales bacterium]
MGVVNQKISWYPGHMDKSFRAVKDNLKLVDIVFLLLDARIPFSSMNNNILTTIKDKKTIILFNKCDLGDEKMLSKWMSYYSNKGFTCLKINSINGLNVSKIAPLTKKVMQEKILSFKNKGLILDHFRAMILGIPNVGKSTLINKLSNKASLKTANTPGVTRSLTWLKLNEDLSLLDTPGILEPKLTESVGINLSIIGSIKDSILPLNTVALSAVNYLKLHYLDRINSRYNIEVSTLTSDNEILECIAKSRNAILKNNCIDYDRTDMIILSDIRNGALGGLCFDFF